MKCRAGCGVGAKLPKERPAKYFAVNAATTQLGKLTRFAIAPLLE